MGREIKRVPLDFDWPLDKVWHGYQWTDEERERWAEDDCPDCQSGWSPYAWEIYQQYCGKVPFRPEDNGSTPLTAQTPAVRAFAERNVTRDEQSLRFYVGGSRDVGLIERAIVLEARRLAEIWNGQLAYHLNEADVEALRAADRLPRALTHRFDPDADPRWQRIEPEPEITAAQLNELAITSTFDQVGAYDLIQARCQREGVSSSCATCDGHASLERFPGQREEADRWERTEPPTGEGWQLWETVSEGSPISPVFATAEELAQWLASPAYRWGAGRPMRIEQARAFVGAGWAPSMVGDANGIQDGATWVADRELAKQQEGS